MNSRIWPQAIVIAMPLNLAFGQKEITTLPNSWGVAAGYDEQGLRPKSFTGYTHGCLSTLARRVVDALHVE